MPFDAGARLGPYEILGPIGAGGMGEIYRARDTRLDRIVAIKILTGALAADAESRQRFEEEARAIAALNDRHICTIHDVGRQDDIEYLVLEYLDGETLAERLKRSAPLAVDEALAIAIQIADGLDRAHRAGIVHRDLKPGNVMLVRRAGSTAPDVKLLDFGLAARTSGATPQPTEASLLATMAPTAVATRPPSGSASSGFTGTVSYMAPEQAEGETGDQRVDIFAFGSVLYEMLAGRKAFEGASVMVVIAGIMSTEPPPIPALATAHPLLDHVLRRCLAKDREQRWQSIADVAADLRWIVDHPAAPAAASARRAPLGPAGKALVTIVLVAAAALTVAGVRTLWRLGRAPEPPALELEVTTPPTDDSSTALSPDGTQIAYIADQDHEPAVWVRPLDSLTARALPGTAGASNPFWSPDGRTIGFFADDKLKRVDIAGGTPIVIANAPNGRGADWGPDGVILYVPGVSAPIMRVSTRGGPEERVTDLDTNSGPAHRLPQFLPDGRHFLFTSTLGGQATNGIYLGSLDRTPPVKVFPGGSAARFVPPDKLLVIRQNALEVHTFDPKTGVVTGEPAVIGQGFSGSSSFAAFTTSATGVLAYRAGTAQQRQLTWVNRRGDVLGTIGDATADFVASPELSADDQSVAVFDQRTGDNDIWIIDLRRGLPQRVTDGPPADAHPIWDPDGGHVVFNSQRFTGGAVRAAVNGGQPEPLFADGRRGVALSWTRDRRFILLRRDNPRTGADLLAVSMIGDRREIPIAQSSYEETEGQFSPDGAWVAFVSNETGRAEVYVQSFPDARLRTQVSLAGGNQVRWAADGREIYYVAPDGHMMAVSIAMGGRGPDVKAPVPLFQTHLATGTNVLGNKPQYAVSRDGRFLLDTAVETPSTPIVVSFNWARQIAKPTP